MILILSSSSDINVDYVISWLNQYDQEYIRLNADEIIESNFKLSLSNNSICINDLTINPNEVEVVWYRKFGGFSKTNYFKKTSDYISHLDLQQLSSEYNSILNAIISLFKHKNWITPPWLSQVNKLDMISLARDFGISVPESWIISSKKELQSIQNLGYKLISKSIFEPYFIQVEEGFYSMFTKQVEAKDILPKTFFPSFVQEHIPKEYEIRIFYLNGKFYSMAIFSQLSKITQMDFRKFDVTDPTRRVPYNLPFEVKMKINKMLTKIGLNCCSIDLIKSSKDGQYYFLEINPTGEFGMVSHPCNYEIYKNIAQTLIKIDKNGKI